MRDTERLVQVEVRNVRANQTGLGNTYQRIHVRPIHVDLTAMLVNDLASTPDCRFKDAMSTRIGNHQTGKILTVLLSLGR